MGNELNLSDTSIVESSVVFIGDGGVGISITIKSFVNYNSNPIAYEEILLTKEEIKRLYELVKD